MTSRTAHLFLLAAATTFLATSPGCFQKDCSADHDAAFQEGRTAGIEEGKQQALAGCQEVDANSLRDRTKLQTLLDLGLPCFKITGELATPTGPARVQQATVEMASAQTETREVKDARKAALKAGGKTVSASVELNKKESATIEQAVKDALLARAKYYGYSRVVQVIITKDCGGRNCTAEAEGVAVK